MDHVITLGDVALFFSFVVGAVVLFILYAIIAVNRGWH